LNFTEANLDAGLRRHDETSLCLKAADFNHPEGDIKSILSREIRVYHFIFA